MKPISRMFWVFMLLVFPVIASGEEVVKARMVESYGKLPLSFEANQGQTDDQVKFLSRGNGYSLFLTPNEAVLALKKAEVEVKAEGKAEALKKVEAKDEEGITPTPPSPSRGRAREGGSAPHEAYWCQPNPTNNRH